MKPTEQSESYPVFEPNQVLSSSHLNQGFNYLDEQERLTRANLIGIGIVCGLEISFDPKETPATIHLSKGCGVTSEGYLIVEPDNTALISYRTYTLPSDPDYPQFKDASKEGKPQYELWELLPADESDASTTPLGTPSNFLNDKAVLLFMELKKEELRNCSPNNCDDRGLAIKATVRALLISKADLDKIIADAKKLKSGLSSAELADSLAMKLGLEDIRLPRYDVPNTGATTTLEVLAAFQKVIKANKLAEKTADILTAVYKAFKPLVTDVCADDSFVATFRTKFGFLDKAPLTQDQVLFLQYYHDVFDDLIKAYDELRWKGVDLMCACCPPEGLFPRHLMAGVLVPGNAVNPSNYRQQFIASPAISNRCGDRTKDLKQLFQRLVELVNRFTGTPHLPAAAKSEIDNQIRITPSTLGDVPLSDKAIPYYYSQDGAPTLYRLWNPERTRWNRAHHSQGYYAYTYSPPAPPFVAEPLSYDLEPYNFLRIEGHLGKDYKRVLTTLLFLKSRYRLPIEIIALRTGALDETISVDASTEPCRFQDLKAMYDAAKAELSCFLCKEVLFFYQLPSSDKAAEVVKLAQPKLPFLVDCAPEFRVHSNTFGWTFEAWLAAQPDGEISDTDPDIKETRAHLFIYLIVSIAKLIDQLTPDLGLLNVITLEKRYRFLISLATVFERLVTGTNEEYADLPNKETIKDRLDAISYHCRLEAFKALHEEYLRRLKEVKQQQFFSFFAQNNPGIQHKAGVPVGGTFIIVYHETSAPIKTGTKIEALDIREVLTATEAAKPTINESRPIKTEMKTAVLDVKDAVVDTTSSRPVVNESTVKAFADVLTREKSKSETLAISDIKRMLEEFAGQILEKPSIPGIGGGIKEADKIFIETINELNDGAVIADFFLPYLCCSDCTPIQFVLPSPPFGFDVHLGCTDSKKTAQATITPHGGTAPYTYKLADQSFKELKGNLALTTGSHTLALRDSAGAETAPKTIIVPEPLMFGKESFIDNAAAQTYQVSFPLSGGTPPYRTGSVAIAGNTFTSAAAKSGEKINVTITDSADCEIHGEYTHTIPCGLPCKGIATLRRYRFSLPMPDDKLVIHVPHFSLEYPEGNIIDMADLTNDIAAIIQRAPAGANYNANIAERINSLIAKRTGNPDALIFRYIAPTSEVKFGLDTWEIEYFECLLFKLQIAWSLAVMTNVPPTTTLTLDQNGSSITEKQGAEVLLALKIPTYNIAQIDKCDPKRPKKVLCEKPDVSLTIKRMESKKGTTIVSAEPTGSAPAAYLWEVQGGVPALANGKRFSFSTSAASVNVRLSAYTKTGCRVVVSEWIKPG